MSRAKELFPRYLRQYRHNNDHDGTGELVMGYDADIEEHATWIIRDVEKAAEVLNAWLADSANTEDELRDKILTQRDRIRGFNVMADIRAKRIGRMWNEIVVLRRRVASEKEEVDRLVKIHVDPTHKPGPYPGCICNYCEP